MTFISIIYILPIFTKIPLNNMLQNMKHHLSMLNNEDSPYFLQDLHSCSYDKNGEIKGTENNGWTLTWSDLSVYVPCEEHKFFTRSRTYYKRIINNVSGAVLPASLVAILGPSGAGKSTMLSAIAHRYHGKILVDGDIRLNGKKIDESMCYLSGFMYQEDFFIGALTIKEHLSYMALLKMDSRVSSSFRESTVSSLIEQLGLSKVANCKIGSLAVDGEKMLLSGGEKKRLSFAAACLTSPKLLFADEPTTGLDSYTAGRLVSLMRAKAYSTGASLVCTIHQPSPEVLAMFSTIYLLAEGMVVFAGSTEEAVNFFQSSGYTPEKQMTHGEFLVKCVAPIPGAENATKIAIKRFAHEFAVSEHYKSIETTIIFHKQLGEIFFHRLPDYKPALWLNKLFWLCCRGFLENLRNPNLQWIKIFQKMLLAIAAGLCYFGTIHLDQPGVQAIQGALFVLVTENTFAPMYAALTNLPQEFPMFIREHSNGAYSSLAYYISRIISSFPGLVIEATTFTTCVYGLAGLKNTFYAFTMINLLTILCINVSASCGTFFSTAFDSVPLAMAYLVPFDYMAMITSGLFIKLSTLPVATMWMQYLSWLMYTYESLSILQWEQVANISCAEDQPYLPCLKSGEEVLENYSFSETHLNRNILALLLLYLCFHVLGYLFFIRKINKRF